MYTKFAVYGSVCSTVLDRYCFPPLWASARDVYLECIAPAKSAPVFASEKYIQVATPPEVWHDDVQPNGFVVVCWLLDVPAICKFISGTDLLIQFYVLPH